MHFLKHLISTFMSLAIAVVTLAIPATGRGDTLFATNNGGGFVSEYTTSGATVNNALIVGHSIADVAVVPVPEPSTGLLVMAGVLGLAISGRARAVAAG